MKADLECFFFGLVLLVNQSCHSATGEEAGGGPSGSGMGGAGADKREDEYQYEVLTTEQIVEFMVKELKEVQNVIQVRGRYEDDS